MSWKDLFVTGDENTEKEQPKQETTTKFPTSTNTTTTTNIFGFPTQQTQPQAPSFTNNQVATEHLEKALEIYQKGFGLD